jgi:hypothetical protein
MTRIRSVSSDRLVRSGAADRAGRGGAVEEAVKPPIRGPAQRSAQCGLDSRHDRRQFREGGDSRGRVHRAYPVLRGAIAVRMGLAIGFLPSKPRPSPRIPQ